MDNKKVAEELLKLAKEITARGINLEYLVYNHFKKEGFSEEDVREYADDKLVYDMNGAIDSAKRAINRVIISANKNKGNKIKMPSKLINLLKKSAKNLQNEIAKLKREGEWEKDESYMQMLTDDYYGLRSVLEDLIKGDIPDAYNTARNMETSARDNIPVQVWKFMERNG